MSKNTAHNNTTEHMAMAVEMTPYEKTRELMRRLVAVPKEETTDKLTITHNAVLTENTNINKQDKNESD
jgi:hypothetical protein